MSGFPDAGANDRAAERPPRRLCAHGRGLTDMRRRIICIFVLLLLSLGGVAGKLFFLQVQQRDRLAERATRQ